MSLVLGLDLGTSAVKSILVDAQDRVLAEASAPLAVSRPHPSWSEQAPSDWWHAVELTLDALAARHPGLMAGVGAIGLSGQMLGVVCLDAQGEALRPAMLWNDARATAECAQIEAAVADFAGLVGCRAMVGFPAPKLRWLSIHEPAVLAATRQVLLPKDFVRLRLTGDCVSDVADASATLLMDTRSGTWSPPLLAASGVDAAQMPRLVGSASVGGEVRPDLAHRWGLPPRVPVVGGAGDNMCGGVGAGVVAPGLASISLGTSGVYFLANDRFLPARGHGMHTHRHAIEGLFAQNGCVLSAGAALAWVAGIVGTRDIAALVAEVEAADIPVRETPVFTPYLAGERTPHDDPGLRATFSGLGLETSRLHLVQSVLEGVALALADCHRAVLDSGAVVDEIRLVGGGANSRLWPRLLASALDVPVVKCAGAAVGPALGAARLARAGIGGPLVAMLDGDGERFMPVPDLAATLADKRTRFAAHLAIR